ncbi:MAG TPA: hypothetical protein VNW53_03380 [Phenylobacterium sp.]|jgi:hypothetical protein|uniref:hypothetical protein n=1 Tax=Phenylobacterium sp. TaxID=1871053 RepID=UPI002C5F774D|nr:hypothetical protein [Phenylobacterium sp.]HXA38016.1 hypothetical protein [Phenylobacterium sp.]
MTTEISATPDNSPTNASTDSPMFAPVPAWERNNKRRGFGGGRAAEPRSFESAPAIDAMGGVDPTDVNFAAGPTFADRTRKSASSNVPIAIVAGLIVLGGIGAVGWYAMQPHGAPGVAELTPGAATTTTTTTTPDASTTAVAQNEPLPAAAAAPPAAKAVTTTTTARSSGGAVTHRATTVARAHRAASVSETAADASTTAPVTPPLQRAAPAAPPAAAAAPPLVLNLPQTAPAPAPATVSPPTTQAAPPATTSPPTAVPQT